MQENGGGNKAKPIKIVKFPTRYLKWDLWASGGTNTMSWSLEKKGLLLEVVSFCWYNQTHPDWDDLAQQIKRSPRTIRKLVDIEFRSVVKNLLKQRTPFDDRDRSAVWSKTGGLCTYCKEPLGAGWHVDHIVPVAAAGLNAIVNLTPSCAACNMAKGARS